MFQDLERLVGADVAGYRLHAVLGQGASAMVFRGESLASPGIMRAIKVIRPELAASVEFTKRFQVESRILNDLVHDNIVRFYSAHRDAQHGVLAMDIELLAGESLADRLKGSRRLEVIDVLAWVGQAARGVGAAHAKGVLHRDLKPENLFLTTGGVVKVLDFGIARAVEEAERTSKLTKEGHVAGTVAYMAPEVWRGDEATPRSDVYALGPVLVELLLGRHPFCGADGKWPTNHQLMYRHIEGELPRVREKRPDVPEAVEAIAQRAMARAQSARFADAREAADAIAKVRATMGSGDTQDGVPAALGTDLSQKKMSRASAPLIVPGVVPGGVATSFAMPQLGGDVAPGSAADPKVATEDVRTRRGRPSKVILGGVAAVAVGVVIAVVVSSGRGKPEKVAPAGAAGVAGAPGVTPVGGEIGAKATEPATAADHGGMGSEVAKEVPSLNVWVLVKPPRGQPVVLGLGEELARGVGAGFRPSRGVLAPSVPYEIQQHEVTWDELDGWLVKTPAQMFPRPSFAVAAPTPGAVVASDRLGGNRPATGVPWQVAYAYCKEIGGRLPSEEEWEYAARGEERRPYAWGANVPDLSRTTVYQGAGATPGPVMAGDQDQTPAAAGDAIYDLMGNAQEWTADLWREGSPGGDESWVQDGATSFRAVRGLPLAEKAPVPLPKEGAAYRDALCATGPCVEQARDAYKLVGFRCTRPAVLKGR